MMFSRKDRDIEDNDFFDGPDIPDEPVEPKKPEPKPDSPDYWDEESEWEHLRPVSRWKFKFFLLLALVVLVVLGVIYFRYFKPYVSEAVQYGYVEHIERRGDVFETYEGELLPYKEFHDTTRVFERNFDFTAENARVAAKLLRMQKKGLPVRVEYKSYRATLPWRGDSKRIVVAVDSVDPSTILPPEFRTN